MALNGSTNESRLSPELELPAITSLVQLISSHFSAYLIIFQDLSKNVSLPILLSLLYITALISHVGFPPLGTIDTAPLQPSSSRQKILPSSWYFWASVMHFVTCSVTQGCAVLAGAEGFTPTTAVAGTSDFISEFGGGGSERAMFV
jgi:hypothetical protein